MIRRLVLENWRAYDRLELDLQPGTTFVVARNGVGKTSLVEGAAWALYGEAALRPEDAVRRGSDRAAATVELVLPDERVLRVTRPMPRRLARGSATPASATLDGAPVPDASLLDILASELGASAPFLSRLTMLRGLHHGLADEASLSLDANLMKIFGIDGLRKALDEIALRRKVLTRQIKDVRQTTPPSAARRRALRDAAEAARQAAEAAADDHRAAAAAEDAARRAAAATTAATERQASETRRREQVTAVAASVSALITRADQARPADDDDADPAVVLLAALRPAESRLAERLDAVRMRQAVLNDRLARLHDALEELDLSGGSCPVCRRPLGPHEADQARRGHHDEIASITGELERTPAEPDADALATLRAAKDRLADLRPPAAAHDDPPTLSPEQAADALETAATTARAALETVVTARAADAAAAAELAAALEEEQADTALTELFRQQALTGAAAAALTAAVDGLMSQTVAPLTEELGSRWKALFDDRGELRLRGGTVSRTVNGLDLPFTAFSDGEQTSAQLLLRLLVLDAATEAGFCWIDEPLEHLDPAARRHVASLLARARSNSGLRQVVVTTYEEPLARRLALRHPEETRIVYVRPDRLG